MMLFVGKPLGPDNQLWRPFAGVVAEISVADHPFITVFFHSCMFLCYPPLDKNERALHRPEGRFCGLLDKERGLLWSLSGDDKGGQHWRKTVPPGDAMSSRAGGKKGGTTTGKRRRRKA